MKIKFDKKIMMFRKGSIKIAGVLLIVFATVAVIGFEYYNKNIGTDVRAAVDGCPDADWVPIADFCIMDDLLAGADEEWGESADSCLTVKDARLCTVAEWMEACRLNEGNIVTIDDMEVDGSDSYEWVGDIESASGGDAVLIGENGCGDFDSDDIAQNHHDHERRCCVNRERY